MTSEALPDVHPGSDLVEALARLGDEAIGGAQVFGTWTFRDPPAQPGSPHYTSVGHGGAVRALTRYLVDRAETYPGLAAFVGMEPHADRVAPHFHGLLAGLDADVPRAVDRGRRRKPEAGGGPVPASFGARHARSELWERWWLEHGMARLESVQGDGAALYVAKYSLKGGAEVPWWQVWEPGALRAQWVRESHARRPRGRRR